ncbi:DUF3265 domain-containing protein [Vibrio sp. La 4.2.2]|nr:DUF3265 domain-containing protein [Vibrio sp. La 4.2.2]MDA0108976.1 DUF3265 domain-containing protein [Vibrio sp. La 4.2.2]
MIRYAWYFHYSLRMMFAVVCRNLDIALLIL